MPEINILHVNPYKSRADGEDDPARLYHPQNVSKTELKLAEVVKSAWEQKTVVGF